MIYIGGIPTGVQQPPVLLSAHTARPQSACLSRVFGTVVPTVLWPEHLHVTIDCDIFLPTFYLTTLRQPTSTNEFRVPDWPDPSVYCSTLGSVCPGPMKVLVTQGPKPTKLLLFSFCIRLATRAMGPSYTNTVQ